MKVFKKLRILKKRTLFGLILLNALAFSPSLWTSQVQAASVTDGAERYRLDNGLTVILKQDQSAPVASIQLWVKTGSANETENEAGLTHLIEHMIFKGTPARKTGEIARAIESAGGHINAYTSFDRTVYYVEIPRSRFDTGVDVLLDAVQHSLFDPQELKREKEVVLEEYRRSLDIPERKLSWDVMDLCYNRHPYGRPIIGYEETIRTFSRQDILSYMDKWYTPDNMVLVAVGDFEPEQALHTIKGLVKEFPERGGAEASRPEEPPQTAFRKSVKQAQVEQVYMDLCWHIPALTHRDMYPLDILEVILGHGKSSRLYKGLKMEGNLVHDFSARAYALADPGLFSIEATLSPDMLNNSLRAMAQEIRKLTREAVPEAELQKARAIVEADFVFGMEDMSGQAGTLGFFQTMTGDMNNADHYLKRLQRVTAADLRRVVRTYFRPENLSIGILGPEQEALTVDKDTITNLFELRDPEKAAGSHGDPETVTKARMITLPTGMQLVVKENHNIPAVSITGAFLGGTRLEKQTQWGISNFTGQMLTRGTSERTLSDIASTVESWGARLNGFSGRNSIGVSARFLSKDLFPGLALVADVVQNSTFPESEIAKVKTDILAGIRAKKDRPMALLFDLFYETLYPRSPYGHPVSGTQETIEDMTRSDLRKWYRQIAFPSNFVLSVVGNVDSAQLIPYVETLFSGFPASDNQIPPIPTEPPLKEVREAHIQRPGAQTHLVRGYLGAGLKSTENPAMALLKTALSGQSGRLFNQLRDKQSLAYAVTAFRRPGLDTGAFGVYLACDPAKLNEAKISISKQLESVREKGITPKELEEAKTYLLGNLAIGHQTNASQAMRMALDELYGLGYDGQKRYIEKIKSVTREDIQAAVRKIIAPQKYVIVTVGP
ncbi:MAG: M16 family metallopeptidase [Thermodesulfobacteriota bacterium]